MADRPRLSFREQLTDACRAGSVKQLFNLFVAAAASTLAPDWWRRAPWSVGRLIEQRGFPIRLDGNRFAVPAGPGSTFLSGLLWLGMYETLERHAIRRWLDPETPVVELGASIGVVSCLTNRRLTDPSRHVCVEANPKVVPVLAKNREANGCGFAIVHAALAYGADEVEFAVSDDVVDSTLLERHGTQRVAVRTTTLARLLREAAFDRCTLICDIEGAEEALMAHEADVIRDKVETVFLEVHPQHLGVDGVNRLYDRFLAIGFQAQWRRGDVWVLSRHVIS